MDTSILLITPDAFSISRWSGGTTTQIVIFPPDRRYANRDFLWRISSAAVDLPESDFTPLPDYNRYIATLKGDMILTHGDGSGITLTPFTVHRFDGGVATKSRGICTDFNLMLRKEKCDGLLSCLKISGPGKHLLLDAKTANSAAKGLTMVIYCVQGSATIACATQSIAFGSGEAVQIETPAPDTMLSTNQSAIFMVASMCCQP